MNIEVIKKNTDEPNTPPLMSEFIENAGFSTTVGKRMGMDVVHFLKDIRSVSSLSNLTAPFINEYNELLRELDKVGLICVSLSKWKNGVLKLDSTSETLLQWLDKIDRHYYERERQEVEQPLTLDNTPSKCSIVAKGGMEFETYVAIKYISKKHNAINRGIDFKLTLSDMRRLLKTKYCKISGKLLELEGDHRLSLDRINPLVGYTKENTIAISKTVNDIKNQVIESCDLTKGMTNKECKKMLLSLADML